MIVELCTGAWVDIIDVLELRLFEPKISDSQVSAIIHAMGVVSQVDDEPELELVLDGELANVGYYSYPVVRLRSVSAYGEVECVFDRTGLVSTYAFSTEAPFKILGAWAAIRGAKCRD